MTPRLPVAHTIRAACLILWRDRGPLAKAAALPAAVTIGSALLTPPMKSLTWVVVLLAFVSLAAYAAFAVTWHRHLLIAESVPSWIPRWNGRDVRFAVWVIVVYTGVILAFASVALSAGFVLSYLAPSRPDPAALSREPLLTLLRLPVIYVIARLSLVFPAASLDRAAQSESWDSTRGNGWRLVGVTSVIPIAADMVGAMLFPDASRWGVASAAVLSAVGFALVIYEVTALSLSYRALVLEVTPAVISPAEG